MRNTGWVGVEIFLVTSSFLIVTLLLDEKKRTGTISVPNFFFRRALRIWPLYFLYLLPVVGFLWISEGYDAIYQHLIPLLSFTANFSYAPFAQSAHFSFVHLWTVSLEWQFYMIIPILLLVSGIAPRHIAMLCVGGIVFSCLYRYYIMLNHINYPTVWVHPFCRLDPFILGGALAYVLQLKPGIRELRYGWVLLVLGLSCFVMITLVPRMGYSMHTVWQLLAADMGAACLVLSAMMKKGTARLFSFGFLPYLGKLSYGLYIYHILAINLGFPTVVYMFPVLAATFPSPFFWLLHFVLTLAMTIAIACLSYEWFEKRFLKYKTRFGGKVPVS